MKIVGTIHAPAQLAISLRQSVIEYCGNHEDGNVRAAVLDLRVCSCNAMIVHHWISLATPLGVELSAAHCAHTSKLMKGLTFQMIQKSPSA
jgi:hypothetical protein